MPLKFDSELMTSLVDVTAPFASTLPAAPLSREDWRALRAFSDASVAALENTMDPLDEVERQDIRIPTYDGSEIAVRWYKPTAVDGRGPAVVYLHGGGMIAGSVELYDRVVAKYTQASGVPFLSVDYRLAPEHPHPTPVEDCYAALSWLASDLHDLRVDTERIAVMGDSAGGGLAAASAIASRDRGTRLARQILIYPMLDDRTTVPDHLLLPFAAWNYDHNYIGWHALLGEQTGTDAVPAEASPARLQEMTGLADAYIEVGELDILRDEAIEYARRLALSGVSLELHVHRGCPHGYDRAASTIEVVHRAWSDRIRVLKDL